MASTGATIGGTAANTPYSTFPDWNNVNNVLIDSDADTATTGTTSKAPSSDGLWITNFGFAIPVGSTIDGIEATIRRRAVNANRVEDYSVSLIVGGAVVGSNLGDLVTGYPTSLTTVTYGGPTSLWGLTPSVAEINASNFGIELRVAAQTQTSTAHVAWMKLNIYYTPAAGGRSRIFELFRSLLPGRRRVFRCWGWVAVPATA